jgi:hypothetical protein
MKNEDVANIAAGKGAETLPKELSGLRGVPGILSN